MGVERFTKEEHKEALSKIALQEIPVRTQARRAASHLYVSFFMANVFLICLL